MNLTADSVPLVYQAITGALASYASHELTGISCIARGADSIFAQAVLDVGGKLEVVLPAASYREKKVEPDQAPQFDELIRQATMVRVMPYEEANRVAYEATNEVLASTCDTLVAIWDGQRGVDKGSTASVVEYARSRGVPVEVIWPEGASRG
jgi:CRISPR/Cas system-associated protein Cas5 (RAMP superfamily)